MLVVFVSKSAFGCGNFHTIDRIRIGLKKLAPDITTEHFDLQAARNFASRSADLDPNIVVVALNLSRCAFLSSMFPPLRNLVLICGGSDLNEDAKSASQRQRMSELIDRSSAIVFFCSSLKSAFLTHWPDYPGVLRTIPQSVLANRETALANKTEALKFVEEKLGFRPHRFVLFVGRLRPVKDPLFLLQPFLEWLSEEGERGTDESKQPSHHLLCVGSVEEDTTEIRKLFSCLKTTDRVHWLESLQQSWVFGLMTAADCLVNSSRSEGQPLTLMEAMAIGCPVLARNIPANLDLIEHERTGLIFSTQAELKLSLQKITEDSDLRSRLVQNAMQKMHSPEYQFDWEAASYLRLLKEISSGPLHPSP